MSLVELFQDPGPAGRQDRKIYGVAVGIVRDIKDPDHLGRVKVDFPSLGEDSEAVAVGSEDRAHSYWARIATLMAGSRRGTFFVPEVDDEVLLAFEHGDVNRPFVVGALWNSEDPPPQTIDAKGKNHRRSIHSRSGHVITLDDNAEEQKAKVTVKSQGGHQLTLDDDGGEGKVELLTAAGHQVTLDDAGGTVTVADKAGNRLVLDANAGSLTVETSGNQDQTVGGNLTIKVTGAAEISAPAGVTVESPTVTLGSSAAMALVKETFLTLFSTHVHTGNLGAPTTPPLVPAIPGVHSTVMTKGA